MKILLAAVVLAVLALVGSRRVMRRARVPLGAQLIFATGTEFVFVGLLLGESWLGVIDGAAVRGLEPFVVVALGWIGLVFGLQFERRSLRALPPNFFTLSVVQALVTLVVVFTAF